MVIKKIILLPLLAFSLTMAQPLFANHSKHNSETSCPCEKSFSKMSKKLDLSEAQTAEIKTIKNKSHESLKQDKKQLRAIQSQIHALALNKTMDEAKLDQLIKQKTAIIATMIKTRAMAKNQMFNCLNAKQQALFQEMVTNWKAHKGSHDKCLCATKPAA